MQLDDLSFMQDGLFENIGQLAYALCLNAGNVLFSTPTFINGAMNWPGGYVLLNQKMLFCAAQIVTGADEGKFYFVPKTVTSENREFEDGSQHDIYENTSAQLVYSDAQPAGGVRVSDMKAYNTVLTDSIVKPVTDPIVEVIEELDEDKTTDVSTAWKTLTPNTSWDDTSPISASAYRFNAIGNLEINGTFTCKTATSSQAVAFFDDSDAPRIAALRVGASSVIHARRSGVDIFSTSWAESTGDRAALLCNVGTLPIPVGTVAYVNITVFK